MAGRPALIAWGERDWCFTPAFRQEFERRLPGAEVERYADAGHYVMEDAVDRIVPRIRRFLQ
jgi:haloalkane dehalogenase